jgi:uncharacterized protein YjbJ (UPF0337 family)
MLARRLLSFSYEPVIVAGVARTACRRVTMNWDRIQGNWKQLKGSVREKWGKLTDDHLNVIDGRREILAGKLQEAYGNGKEEADREITDWQKSIQDAANAVDAIPPRMNARR